MGLHGASAGSCPRRSLACFPSKSQDPLSGLEVIDLEVKSRGVSSAVSGRTGSKTGPAGDCRAAARRCPAPWDLLPRGLDLGVTCVCAAVSRPIGSGPMILCGNHGGCPVFTQSWRMTEGLVASSSWVKSATDLPPTFKLGTIPKAKHRSPASLPPSALTRPEILSSRASPPQI
jgi:hypothetical protein